MNKELRKLDKLLENDTELVRSIRRCYPEFNEYKVRYYTRYIRRKLSKYRRRVMKRPKTARVYLTLHNYTSDLYDDYDKELVARRVVNRLARKGVLDTKVHYHVQYVDPFGPSSGRYYIGSK